ncbi:MAG TPA: HisA/HisF-related TIM barrel protein [Methanothrix sp.]|nr:HisA/HisF-related TIM barrel protein [Methanothrix sp.]HPJ83745.1 HisA/HisF-related TIM barrel protein [Methanothrix sp.]HPR67394.1 HisA/HisF-related TIM barrel protein [Methanothrix sp.]
MTRCVFVLDLFNGSAVHAVRGEREKYQPIATKSKVVNTSDPISILELLRPKEVYVADLDRITGSGDNLALIGEMARKVETMADVGISSVEELDLLPISCKPVLGTETGSFELIERASSKREVTVSVDLFEGEVLTRDAALKVSPLDLIRRLNPLPIKEIILLALDRVGTSMGLDEVFLRKAASLSDHPILLGGGVKDGSDLDRLGDLGLAGALVATAIHDGSVPLERVR